MATIFPINDQMRMEVDDSGVFTGLHVEGQRLPLVLAETDPVTGGITIGGQSFAVTPILVQWNGTDDTAAIDAALLAAGQNGSIAFAAGKVYKTSGGHELLSGQSVFGNNATLKKIGQVTSVLNTGVTYSTGAASVDVANPERFVAGMWVTVTSPLSAVTTDSTYYTDASSYKQTKPARVISVVGNTVTCDRTMDILAGGTFTLSAANGALLAENAPIFFCGKNWNSRNLYTWDTLPQNIRIYDLTIDGDRLNNTEGAWWNVAPTLELSSHYISMERCTIQNGASEGVVFSGKSPRIRGCVFNTLDGNATHPGAYDGSNGTEDMLVENCSARDTLKTFKRGHGYGAFIFSNNNFDAKYVNCHVDTSKGHAFGSGHNSSDSRFVLTGCTAKNCEGGFRISGGTKVVISNNIFENCRNEASATIGNGSGIPCSEIVTAANNVIISNNIFTDSPVKVSSTSSYVTISGNIFSGPTLGTPAGGAWSALLEIPGDGAKANFTHVGNQYYGPASVAINCFKAGSPMSRFASSGNVYHRGNTGLTVYGASQAFRIQGDTFVDQFTNGLELRPNAAGGANIYCSATIHATSGATLAATWSGIRADNSSGTSARITIQGCDIWCQKTGGTCIGINVQNASTNMTLVNNAVRVTSAGHECIQANTALDATSLVAGNVLSKAFTSGVGTAVVTGLTGNLVI